MTWCAKCDTENRVNELKCDLFAQHSSSITGHLREMPKIQSGSERATYEKEYYHFRGLTNHLENNSFLPLENFSNP